jgi:DNA-binding MarR family transcriptional regulator
MPDVDLETEAITQRIHVLNRYFERSLAETTDAHGVGIGEYKVLTALRGSGPPYRISPSKLAKALMLSTGAMTNRLDNLEEAELVRRLPDPDDRRALQVELTEKGWQLWQDMVSAQAEKEALIASALGESEKVRLNALLRKLMREAERRGGIKKKPFA